MSDKHSSSENHCPDCGPAGVPHWVEKLSAGVDMSVSYLAGPRDAVWNVILFGLTKLRPGRLAPPVFGMFARTGMCAVLTEPDGKSSWRARVLWEEAERRGIRMREVRFFGLPRETFFASENRDARMFDGVPRPRSARGRSLSWMDDKGSILGRFRKAGIPVPRGKACRSLAQAEAAFKEIAGPVIVKPNLGSRSRHTYVNITDLASLHHAFIKAKELSPYPVIEEELSGFVFRVTLVGGRVAGVMRREPPHIIGDGKRTVRELVAEENRNPLRHGPLFHELAIDEEAKRLLSSQKYSSDSIPEKGAMVILNQKVSRSFGASTTEITDVHPENIELFEKIASVLDDPLVGVDFMIGDMANSWRSQKKCGVIECNSLPFIDLHHYPLKGPARNVAAKVWDIAFASS